MIRPLLVLICLVATGKGCFAAGTLKPANLYCEYLKDPLGIDRKIPELGWTFESAERDQIQSAFELIVSDNPGDISLGKGNCWSTGKLISSASHHIEYAGKPLKPFTKYYWRVKIYNDRDEASPWSEPASFETAMLSPADWSGGWIGDGQKNPADPERYKDDRMPLFRKEFDSRKKIVSARLYISGLGYYEAYLNGKKISDHLLDPGLQPTGKRSFTQFMI